MATPLTPVHRPRWAAVTALVLGILSTVTVLMVVFQPAGGGEGQAWGMLGLFVFVGWPLAIIGLILGIIALARRQNKVLALLGILLCLVPAAVTLYNGVIEPMAWRPTVEQSSAVLLNLAPWV